MEISETVISGRSHALRRLLNSKTICVSVEAHSGISALLAERAGFKCIWASGLSIATELGLRDANEASWTEVLATVERMADVTRIPILHDGDTGYGNFNNARRLVRKLCQIGVAGVCIEDKVFPKMNSFYGNNQSLAPIPEFCGKIKACKDSQLNEEFVVVARIEALVSGRDMNEALSRAHAYFDAGADAILIHSKLPVADEVLSFARRWDGRCPLVIIPTTYARVPIVCYQNSGISMIVWANHAIRATIATLRDVYGSICSSGSVTDIEDEIAPVSEIFEVLNYEELAHSEARYHPSAYIEPDSGAAVGSLRANHRPDPSHPELEDSHHA